ncbi:hypothetical protein LXL04_031034 [Taraxacum kok-saghyz]
MIGTSVPKIFLKSRTQIREHDFIRIFSINKPELIKSYSRCNWIVFSSLCKVAVELLRLSMSSSYRLDSWFTYSILLLFLCTTGFWMARLNEGLSQFDAILNSPDLMEPCMLYCLRDVDTKISYSLLEGKEEESQKAELQTEGDVMKAKTIQLRTSPKFLHATRLEESTEGIREIDWIRLPATY